MSTRCFENESEYRCRVRLSNVALVLEKQEITGEVKKIPIHDIKELVWRSETSLEITTLDNAFFGIIVNDLIKKDVELLTFLHKFIKEQQDLMRALEEALHNYVCLISPIFRILSVLTKGNIPEWTLLNETSRRLQDFVEAIGLLISLKDFSKNVTGYLKALNNSVERRNITALMNASRNYVKYVTGYFSEVIMKIPISIDLTYLIDLTLVAFTYYYSRELRLPLQAERARNEFKHLTSELILKTYITDEVFRDRVMTSYELILESSKSPEEIPQRLLESLREELMRYVTQPT
ncbi:MAG: hypothetical protein QXP80_05280 [Zestosphaera sp.]